MSLALGLLLLNMVFFVALVVHEFSHALVAKVLGVRIKSISFGVPAIFEFSWRKHVVLLGPLFVMGGVHPDEDDFEALTWWKHLLIALAGPVGSVLFGVSLVAILRISGAKIPEEVFETQCDIQGLAGMGLLGYRMASYGLMPLIAFNGFVNIVIGISNLLPIPPLDGGRILFAILEGIFGQRARRIGKWISIIGAVLIIASLIWTAWSEVGNVAAYTRC